MISANAAGENLRTFVFYKSTNLWSTWCVEVLKEPDTSALKVDGLMELLLKSCFFYSFTKEPSKASNLQ